MKKTVELVQVAKLLNIDINILKDHLVKINSSSASDVKFVSKQ